MLISLLKFFKQVLKIKLSSYVIWGIGIRLLKMPKSRGNMTLKKKNHPKEMKLFWFLTINNWKYELGNNLLRDLTLNNKIT